MDKNCRTPDKTLSINYLQRALKKLHSQIVVSKYNSVFSLSSLCQLALSLNPSLLFVVVAGIAVSPNLLSRLPGRIS